MGNTIDRGTLDRLIALGRARGELTADELHAALPVDSLDVDALVLVILELEAAGIGVEPEAFGPRPAGPAPLAQTLPSAASARPTVARAMVGEGPALAARPAPPEVAAHGPAGASGERAAVDRLVLVAGLAVFLLAAIVLVLL